MPRKATLALLIRVAQRSPNSTALFSRFPLTTLLFFAFRVCRAAFPQTPPPPPPPVTASLHPFPLNDILLLLTILHSPCSSLSSAILHSVCVPPFCLFSITIPCTSSFLLILSSCCFSLSLVLFHSPCPPSLPAAPPLSSFILRSCSYAFSNFSSSCFVFFFTFFFAAFIHLPYISTFALSPFCYFSVWSFFYHLLCRLCYCYCAHYFLFPVIGLMI